MTVKIVAVEGRGYSIYTQINNDGSFSVDIDWQKRGRKPAILKQLKPLHTDPNGDLKKFRSKGDSQSVIRVVINYMAKYDAKRK